MVGLFGGSLVHSRYHEVVSVIGRVMLLHLFHHDSGLYACLFTSWNETYFECQAAFAPSEGNLFSSDHRDDPDSPNNPDNVHR